MERSAFRAVVVAATLCIASSAFASVYIGGKIEVWNPLTHEYEPLQKARVRVVLAEYSDGDTFDKEDTTDRQGGYHITKGNPWLRSFYKAYLSVFAESPWKLEVQEFYGQIDGYQAESNTTLAKQNSMTTINMRIGGPQPHNVDRFLCGGNAPVDWLHSPGLAGETTAECAFWIYHEMTDHRLYLTDRALSDDNFEEKEVLFPSGDGAHRVRVLDYIEIPGSDFPDSYDTQADLDKLLATSHTLRHELSHGIMADEYWAFLDSAGDDHKYWGECPSHEASWNEGWANYAAHFTLVPRYETRRMLNPDADVAFIDCEASPKFEDDVSGLLATQGDLIEGRVAHALWDLSDPVGWERRALQIAAIPGDEMFYDGICDPDFDKVWSIFSGKRPMTFAGGHDAFMDHWAARAGEEYGSKHDMKAILWNQAIHVPGFTEGALQLADLDDDDIEWDKFTAKIPVTVTEYDPEDRPYVHVDVFLNGRHTSKTTLGAEGWNGATKSITVEQDIAWTPGEPKPNFTIACDDDMISDYKKLSPTPPPNAVMGGVVAEVLEINVRRTCDPPLPDSSWPSGMPRLNSIYVTVAANDGIAGVERQTSFSAASPHNRIPTFASMANASFKYDEVTEVYRGQDRLPEAITLRISAGAKQAVEWAGSELAELTPTPLIIVNPRNVDYRFTPQSTAQVLDETVTVRDEHDNERSVRTVIEVVYRLRPISPTLVAVTAIRPMVALAYQPLLHGVAFPLLPEGEPGPPGRDVSTLPIPGLLSRSSQLVEEYARTQGEILAIAAELETKLDPNWGRQAEPTETTKGRDASGNLIKPRIGVDNPSLAGPNGTLQTPEKRAFLTEASGGRAPVRTLTPEQREYLEELRATIAAYQSRLPQIEKACGKVRARLGRLQQDVTTADGPMPIAREAIISRIERANTLLAGVSPTAADYRRILGEERQTIDRALKAPGGKTPEPTAERPEDWTATGGATAVRSRDGMEVSVTKPGEAMSEDLDCSNLRITFRYNPGTADGEVGLCVEGEGDRRTGYVVRLLQRSVVIDRVRGDRATKLGAAPADLQPGKWYDVKIEIVRGRMKVYLNDEPILSAADEGRHLTRGHLTFGCPGGGGADFREIRHTRF